MLSSGVFRRETASGFYPWGNVEYPRKRVAERLCGWRHGNSFPMAQSAQSHRQMRSIPRCPKAVFYVFVFDSIHNSATMLNPSPSKFPTEPKKAAGAVTSAAGKKLFYCWIIAVWRGLLRCVWWLPQCFHRWWHNSCECGLGKRMRRRSRLPRAPR